MSRPNASGSFLRDTEGLYIGVAMVFLRSVRMSRKAGADDSYPFNLPLVKAWKEIKLRAAATILVGENGSGKSTFLEAVAAGARVPAIGRKDVGADESLAATRRLAQRLTLSWGRRSHRGFFLRAEDFFNFARRMAAAGREMEEYAAEFRRKFKGRARDLAVGSVLGQREEIRRRYGDDLDANSHGESFLKLFQARMVPGGLYLLDEPEAPLSPQRQLALMAALIENVKQGSQFIIATHSPILMALPGAVILSFDSSTPRETVYGDLAHVSLTRNFLNNPESFLRHLR